MDTNKEEENQSKLTNSPPKTHDQTRIFCSLKYQYILIVTQENRCAQIAEYFCNSYFCHANQLAIIINMNLNIDRLLPSPPIGSELCIFTFLPPPQNSLLLYSPLPPPEKPEEPKKKFAFKSNAQATITVQIVHLFDLTTKQWRSQQTKGKFPSRRNTPVTACLGPCLMLYGGAQLSPSKQLNDLYCLNLTSWQWKKLFCMESPPANANPQAICLQDKLIIATSEIWVFNTKGVNWNAQSTDLPGGLWQKLAECELPFASLCGFFNKEELIIFGGEENLSAVSINIEAKEVTKLEIEGDIKVPLQSIKLCATSEGYGLLADQNIFCSFILHKSTIFFTQKAQIQQRFLSIAPVETDKYRTNYCINHKKELLEIQPIQTSEEEEIPNTARQIAQEEASHRSSRVVKSPYEENSARPPPSPLSASALNNPIITKLSPLLAKQWLRRRILEEKGKLLEETIKKAERMVLSLCRYGNEEQKQQHIVRVCRLRQSLCKVLQSQSFIRRQMDERPGQLQLRTNALKEEHGPSFFDPNQL